ncbi:probable ATP-dependent DNA helicase HFM1 isoform X2 [Coregonus clupeaformis]|uniref:probable ATP-dependent DNA helicase HFM1 isoform X2 n=1 Tax=Coregonus clupeaformis TaxID=59861 RepID=UPI001BE1193B|nr:probable ATP-dependent DNA helicase HFM1 isoform X2 [Coregonus clupeaformis]
MLDSEDCTLSLDNLFFERPVVHKVKPLCQEQSFWQLEPPPSLSQIPATQDIQKESEGLSSFSFSQKSNKFLPHLKRAVDGDGFTPKNTKLHQNTSDGGKEPEAQGGCALWAREDFMNKSQDTTKVSRGRTKTPQDSGHALEQQHFPLFSQSPPLRRSLFKPPSGQVLKKSANSNRGLNQARPRVQQTFNQVSMATEPRLANQSAAGPSPLTSLGPPKAWGPPQKTQDKGTKRAHVLPMTPQALHIQSTSGPGILRPISEIPAKFRSVFKEFPYFNYVQSKALDDVLYTGKNFVACAPTGSGKTVLFELAIIRLLMETTDPLRNIKAVYMAPIKALCSQRFEDWKKKFGPLGLSCKELTGDTEIDDFFEIQDAHIIMTTPEKWDSMTRKWRDNCLLQLVRLFLIDEVHVVKDPMRGATLEVVVSRMKAVHAYRAAQNPQEDLSMRFVAVSATIPNIKDIADWLCDDGDPATCLEMDESHRPVKLRKVVLGFPCSSNQNEFKFDLSLNYKMANIIQTYSDQKPTLVFCSTRKGVQQSATVLAKDARFIMSIEHKQRLMKYANSLLDSKLRDLVSFGVGFHHAGVDVSDRKGIEEAFTMGDLPVLFTTSTLAMGVNLPAHLVVIKSTMHYIGGACEEYSEADMLQMIGRAGRPQFDTSATAVIMTKTQTKDKYMQFMNGAEIIESSLHSHLVEHLNAEIVLHTISDVNMALDWIRSSFLYIRALKNPKHYGFSIDLDRCGIEAKLQELCLKNLNSLASIGLISMDEDVNIKATEAGRLMARYCVAFDTMKQFSKVAGTETLPELIELMAKGREFTDVQLRVNEKRTLNTLNKDKNRITIRYPMEGKIKNKEMKVNCLIQAQFGSIPIQEFGLAQDTGRIFRNGVRLSRCLAEFLNQRSKTGFSALLNSLILAKCFRAKLWENSPYVSKQLEKIGLTLSTAMVNAGLTTFNKIEQTNARELELIVNRHPPFGNQIRDAVINLPKYEVSLEQLPRYNVATAEIVVTVNVKNHEQLLSKRTTHDHHYVTMIIGDCDNNVVFLQKLTDLMLLKSGSWSKKIEVAKAFKGEEISVNLISSEYVGLDIQQKFSAFYSGPKRYGGESLTPEQHNTMQIAQANAQRSQGATQRIQPTGQQTQATAQKRNSTSTEKGSSQPDLGKRQCNHFCKNKDQCGHDCCQNGVTVVLKRPMNQHSSFSSYLQDLKTRSDTLTDTPVKRLKMRKSGGTGAANIQQFSYTPQPILPPACRYVGNRYGASAIQQSVESAEDFATPQEMAYLENYGHEYNDYLEDIYQTMGEVEPPPIQTPTESQSPSMWRKPSAYNGGSFSHSTPQSQGRGYPQSQVPSQNQCRGYPQSHSIPQSQSRSYSPSPIVDLTDDSSFISSSHTPSVTFDLGDETFDLGDEWDDWDDFDDDNLVHASETSCTTVAKTQWVDRDRLKGHSTPLPSTYVQPKPRFTVSSAPLSSTSPVVPQMAATSLPVRLHNLQASALWSHSNNKATTDTSMALLGGQFEFFSKTTTPNNDNVTGKRLQGEDNSKEVEAFMGIFAGLF